MLQEIFPKIYRSYQLSPWAEELEEFAVWLRTIGYSPHSTYNHLSRLKQALELRADFRPRAAFTIAQLHEAFNSGFSPLQAVGYHATQRAYQRFLAAKGRLITPPICDRFAALRFGYRQYLAELRGFSGKTIHEHDATVRDFLSRALGPHQVLTDLTCDDVERYLLLKSPGIKRQSLQHIVAHLRSFLHYSYEQGEIRSRLEGTIDTPRTYRDELPPRAIDWGVVQEFLTSIDCKSRTGWRDYTILHLMAHYGLRPSEIVTLRWDSIDWRERVLYVEQRKTRSSLVLPLMDQTLSVLRCYFSRERPSGEHPELFLRARSPAGALTNVAVTHLFKKWARRSDLPLDGYSAYCLRHTFAMRLLERGVGVKTIGDLLGHRNLESTCQYLRLDINILRQVALPIPNIEETRRLR
jgi:integrase/recombinase XerD